MISISVLKACLASLFGCYLVSAPVTAAPTLQSAHEPATLQVRDDQAPDVGVSMYGLAFKHTFLTMIQAINKGSLAYTASTLTSAVFTELDCTGDQLGRTLVYSQDVGFGEAKASRIRHALPQKVIHLQTCLPSTNQAAGWMVG